MHRRVKQLCLFMAITLAPQVFANLLPIFMLNELQVTQDGWLLELHGDFEEFDLTGFFLTSRTDTAFFKDSIGVNTGYGFLVVTPDSLTSPFNLDPAGDILSLYTPDSFRVQTIAYGPGGYSLPVAPLPHQSICFFPFEEGWVYLDNTPTFGSHNDTANAQGHVYGIVTDTLGNPLAGVAIHGHGVDTTDSAGHFHTYGLARYAYFYFSKENYQTRIIHWIVYPDSSINVTVEMTPTVQAIDQPESLQPESYSLSPNYPNPFNTSTVITYQLPEITPVEIVIYNPLGQEVQRLYSGTQPAGSYRLQWNALQLASGIYIYQLRTPQRVISRKCLLLK